VRDLCVCCIFMYMQVFFSLGSPYACVSVRSCAGERADVCVCAYMYHVGARASVFCVSMKSMSAYIHECISTYMYVSVRTYSPGA
jgi:hypothetical protein